MVTKGRSVPRVGAHRMTTKIDKYLAQCVLLNSVSLTPPPKSPKKDMPRMNERQRLMLAGAIQSAYTKANSIAQLARKFCISWATAKSLLSVQPNPPPKRCRSSPARVVLRRKHVSKLAEKIARKKEAVWPVHPSAKSIKEALPPAVSVSTVRRDLIKSGFESRVRRFVPSREPGVILKRFKFAKKYRNMPAKKLRSHVFSDEHYVSTNDNSSRRMWVRRKAKVLTRQRKRMQNVPHLQLWAAVGVGYKSDVVIFPRFEEGSAYRLTGEKYVSRCLAKVAPALQQNRIFVQDGARPHVKKNVIDYMSRKGITRVEDWPPYSPDMNPIEKVWALLNRGISELRPTTLDELIAATKEAWRRIPQAQIDRHCMWYSSRLKEVYKNNGHS